MHPTFTQTSLSKNSEDICGHLSNNNMMIIDRMPFIMSQCLPTFKRPVPVYLSLMIKWWKNTSMRLHRHKKWSFNALLHLVEKVVLKKCKRKGVPVEVLVEGATDAICNFGTTRGVIYIRSYCTKFKSLRSSVILRRNAASPKILTARSIHFAVIL